MNCASRASGIYRIRNTVSGSIYIGSAKSFSARCYQHRNALLKGKHYSMPLTAACRKYGLAALVFEIVEIVPDQSRLVEREQFWIDSLKPSYNSAPRAGNTLGYRYTSAQRAKLSLAQRAYAATHKRTPEQIERQRQQMLGRKISPEHRAKLVAVQQMRKGIPRAEAVRAKISGKVRAFNARPDQVAERQRVAKDILDLHASNMTQPEIAKRLGISGHVVGREIRRAFPESAGRHNGRPPSSGVRGITWHKKNSRWTVFVYPGNGKSLYLGSFATIEEATLARKRYLEGCVERIHVTNRPLLSASVVNEIRERFRAGEKQVILARRFGLDDGTMSRIVNGKSYAK